MSRSRWMTVSDVLDGIKNMDGLQHVSVSRGGYYDCDLIVEVTPNDDDLINRVEDKCRESIAISVNVKVVGKDG